MQKAPAGERRRSSGTVPAAAVAANAEEMQKMTQQVQTLNVELQKLDAMLKKSEAENQELKAKLDEAIKQAASAGAQAQAAQAAQTAQAQGGDQATQALAKELENAKAEIQRLLDQNKALQAEVDKLKAQVAQLQKQLTDQTNHFQEAQMAMAKGTRTTRARSYAVTRADYHLSSSSVCLFSLHLIVCASA